METGGARLLQGTSGINWVDENPSALFCGSLRPQSDEGPAEGGTLRQTPQGLTAAVAHGGRTYSADFQKCPGWERRRFSLGSFSSMSISWLKLGLSCRLKAQQADRISCREHWGWWRVGSWGAGAWIGQFLRVPVKLPSARHIYGFCRIPGGSSDESPTFRVKMQGSRNVYRTGLPQGGASVLLSGGWTGTRRSSS